MFALDYDRKNKGEFLLLMLEPGTGQALELPVSFLEFHNKELIEYREAALAADFYDDWRQSGGFPPKFEQCVGYNKPLFLGGSDSVQNLELVDLDVYWTITAQLLSNIRNLTHGTPIGEIRFSE
jgi:hypothetical protein